MWPRPVWSPFVTWTNADARLSQAATVLTIPDHAQGAAIGGGGLWIARSDWNWGTLDRLDPVTGAPQRRYGIAPGTEGLAFGNTGRLWAVSEAGSRHIYDHPFLGLFQPWMSRGKVPDSGQPQHDGWLGETYGAA